MFTIAHQFHTMNEAAKSGLAAGVETIEAEEAKQGRPLPILSLRGADESRGSEEGDHRLLKRHAARRGGAQGVCDAADAGNDGDDQGVSRTATCRV